MWNFKTRTSCTSIFPLWYEWICDNCVLRSSQYFYHFWNWFLVIFTRKILKQNPYKNLFFFFLWGKGNIKWCMTTTFWPFLFRNFSFWLGIPKFCFKYLCLSHFNARSKIKKSFKLIFRWNFKTEIFSISISERFSHLSILWNQI